MLSLDRRFDSRLPLEVFLNAYVQDRPHRGFTANISENGLYLNTVAGRPLPARARVGLEFTLPGLGETIWAAGEMKYAEFDEYFCGRGIRFTAMASAHARLLRAYLARARTLALLLPRGMTAA